MSLESEAMIPAPPLDTPLLIFAPETLGPRCHFAIRARLRSYKLPRRTVYAWRGGGSTNVLWRQFEPTEWLPLEPTIN
jgi:hypothetical protein